MSRPQFAQPLIGRRRLESAKAYPALALWRDASIRSGSRASRLFVSSPADV